ncbi:MAG: phospho-N-acetylmuramoyl-pentapeptide-transferase [Limnochordales bacterium]|nr:phospho-N-acetylmuramoyl-pentapeptide-transferase [Limnochordales bacterium]
MWQLLASFLLAVVVVLVLGPGTIALLRRLKARQTVRSEGPATHYQKSGTPTMGGLLLLVGTAVATLLFVPPEGFTRAALLLFVTVGYGLLGLTDDFLKAVFRRSLGLRARTKFLWQVVLALLPALWLVREDGLTSAALLLPFSAGSEWVLPLWAFLPFSVLVIAGSSNAVNLTDGLDGLAAGTVAAASLGMGLLHARLGDVGGAVYAFSLAGACTGFLWFNSYPARVFMGDTGALALGAGLGSLAILGGTALFLVLIGGIFVAETLSVMVQVFSFKLFHRRVFRMAPLHHHFELAKWPEPVVVARFWVVGILLAVLGLLASVPLR